MGPSIWVDELLYLLLIFLLIGSYWVLVDSVLFLIVFNNGFFKCLARRDLVLPDDRRPYSLLMDHLDLNL